MASELYYLYPNISLRVQFLKGREGVRGSWDEFTYAGGETRGESASVCDICIIRARRYVCDCDCDCDCLS